MGNPLLTAASAVLCSHGGSGFPIVSEPRVRSDGQPLIALDSPWVNSGCPGAGPAGIRCSTATWLSGTSRVLASGRPLVSASSIGRTSPDVGNISILLSQDRVRGV